MTELNLRLYGYWRSTSSWRVRIALAIKGLEAQSCPVHLLKDGGQQYRQDHLARNPQAQVPVLEHQGRWLSQSLAICEYLDQLVAQPRLLPVDPWKAAQVRSLAQVIACDIQPLQNLRVLQTVDRWPGHEGRSKDWAKLWIDRGLSALEERLSPAAEDSLDWANAPGLFELCLIPQMFNARRFDVDLDPYPTLRTIEEACLMQTAFSSTHPNQQPEAETP